MTTMIKEHVQKIYALKNQQLTSDEKTAEVEKLETEILAISDPDGTLKGQKCGLIQTLYSAMGLMPWKWNDKQLVIAGIRHKCGMPIHKSMQVALGLIPAPTPTIDTVNAELAVG